MATGGRRGAFHFLLYGAGMEPSVLPQLQTLTWAFLVGAPPLTTPPGPHWVTLGGSCTADVRLCAVAFRTASW